MYSFAQNELILFVLDVASMLSAFAAAFFWYRASGGILRRIRRFEEVDHHDFNRVVEAYNNDTTVELARRTGNSRFSTLRHRTLWRRTCVSSLKFKNQVASQQPS